MDNESEKAARVIFLLKKLQNGIIFSTVEAHKMVEKEFGTTSLRTVQRDLNTLLECEPLLFTYKDGKKPIWKIDRSITKTKAIVHFDENELLSFHILKAHLKAFRQTVIEEEINQLTKKLDVLAPNEVFSTESLYWDQNAGQFDYTQYDPIIRRIIKYIAEKQWVKVYYRAIGKKTTNDFTILIRCFFQYSGSLYCVAYVPHYDHHIALSVQHIEKLEPLDNIRKKIPPFDFKKFSKSRFGVFYGTIRKVELRINKIYNEYFENRIWHQTQKIEYDKNGNLIITMRVPLGDDFKSWIMSWCEAITVIKPVDLIKEINMKLRNSLKNYE